MVEIISRLSWASLAMKSSHRFELCNATTYEFRVLRANFLHGLAKLLHSNAKQ